MNIIGTGVDIVSIDRLKDILEKTPSFENKILTEKEIEYCRSKRNYLQHMAGRFAAKEAVYKALSELNREIYFKDIEIESNKAKPVIVSGCKVAEIVKKNELGYSLSISHEYDYAVAYAVFWEK